MTSIEIKAQIYINLASDTDTTPTTAYDIATRWADYWEYKQELDNTRIPQKEWIAFAITKPPTKTKIEIKSDNSAPKVVDWLSQNEIRYYVLKDNNWKWRDIQE